MLVKTALYGHEAPADLDSEHQGIGLGGIDDGAAAGPGTARAGSAVGIPAAGEQEQEHEYSDQGGNRARERNPALSPDRVRREMAAADVRRERAATHLPARRVPRVAA